MNTNSKRKNVNEEDSSHIAKKSNNKENCPHAERCYRRNPHHFKEYEHTHLLKFLEAGDNFALPADFPQELQVVKEQLEILKSLQKVSIKAPVIPQESDANSKHVSQINREPVLKTETQSCRPSTSNESKKQMRTNRKEKSTVFVPNSNFNVSRSGRMIEKLQAAAPYYIFFSNIPDSPEVCKGDNVITFSDLLCPSLGELKNSMQINFMIDIAWLIEQYQVHKIHSKPLTLVCGYDWPDMKKYIEIMLPNVTYHLVHMKDPFGTHHSKVGLYLYENGSIRVVVSTANLYFEDWNYYNQGLWISPECPKLPDTSSDSDGCGPTDFKTNLLTYLKSYNLPCMKDWIECVKRTDFSDVKVFLTMSIPGKHYPKSNTGCHLQRVGDLLTRHAVLPPKTTPDSEGPLAWSIIAQASSLGSFGKSENEWLRRFFLRSLASHQKSPLPDNSKATLNVVYPTASNVMHSYYGANGGGCLPYARNVHEKQKWFEQYLHQWKADHLHRSRAMPHIKTYCRVSPCTTKLAWFLLTSANISKAAWGGNIQKDAGVHVRSYEVGVLFLPKFFDEEHFIIKDYENSGKKLFPFIYDLPLTPYADDDEPWCN